MKAIVVIGKNYELNKVDFNVDYVVGVEQGAYLCYKNKLPLDVAIGDFDSISKEELEELKSYCKVIKLNPVKDETDTLEAIRLCNEYDEIVILGGICGKRIEHFYSNLLLLSKDNRIVLKDDNSYIFTLERRKRISKGEYKYISIFSLTEESILTLKGFKYPLMEYHMDRLDTIGISNELQKEEAEIIPLQGKLLVVLSKEDHHEIL